MSSFTLADMQQADFIGVVRDAHKKLEEATNKHIDGMEG